MQTKVCTTCKKEKFILEFHKLKKGKYGVNSRCKECKQKYQQQPLRKLYNKQYKCSINGQLSRQKEIAKRHNITLEQYNKIFEKQKGVCAVCKQPESNRRLAIDHNHKTGKIRGLLCRWCNIRLSILENNEFVKKAKEYFRNNS